jgi:methionine-S-sulfoxide reductase
MTARLPFTWLVFALLATICQQTAPFLESPTMAAENATKSANNPTPGESASGEPASSGPSTSKAAGGKRTDQAKQLQAATFGSGCFWCTEAVFQRLRGVKSVVSGYSGGHVEKPTYEQVSTGRTGHAEVIQIQYDPKEISYEDLLRVFWETHDPTTPNQQGHDIGPQYRSAIFFHNQDQRRIAEDYKKQLDKSGTFKAPIVTEITAYKNFHPAEKYHQNYFDLNPTQRYCQFVIRPKVEKFNKEFKDLLKDTAKSTK